MPAHPPEGEVFTRSIAVDDAQRARPDVDRPEFMGNVIAGIYEGIRTGAANNESHFALAAGRDHQSWREYFDGLTAAVW